MKIIKILEIFEFHLKRRVKGATKLTWGDIIFIKVIDTVRCSLFFSSINDMVLYSTHELLHHDLRISQSSLSRDSYYQALFIFMVTCFDLLRIGKGLYELDRRKILKYEKAFIMISTMKKIEEASIKKLVQKVKKIKRNQRKVSPKKIDDDSKNSNLPNDFENDLENIEKVLRKKKEKLEELDKRCYFLTKNWLYKFGATTTNMIKHIKPECLCQKSYARYYNYSKILKTVIFELLIVSLQNLPILQISLIFSIQLLSSISTIYYAFYLNIFQSCMWALIEIMTELCLTMFLGVGFFMGTTSRDNNPLSTWSRVQFICIFFTVFISVANIFVTVINISGMVMWETGSFLFHKGFFGKKWVRYRSEQINEFLLQQKFLKKENVEISKSPKNKKIEENDSIKFSKFDSEELSKGDSEEEKVDEDEMERSVQSIIKKNQRRSNFVKKVDLDIAKVPSSKVRMKQRKKNIFTG